MAKRPLTQIQIMLTTDKIECLFGCPASDARDNAIKDVIYWEQRDQVCEDQMEGGPPIFYPGCTQCAEEGCSCRVYN